MRFCSAAPNTASTPNPGIWEPGSPGSLAGLDCLLRALPACLHPKAKVTTSSEQPGSFILWPDKITPAARGYSLRQRGRRTGLLHTVFDDMDVG